MAPTVSDVRIGGTDIITIPQPIYEPLNAPDTLGRVLGRFGDNYNLSPDSHLTRFILSLCGESGAGSIQKELLDAKLQQRLEATAFYDLDRLYGSGLALPRLSTEIYSINVRTGNRLDPENEMLDSSSWDEVKLKDAAYRVRCLTWMRAILEGSTIQGVALAAEAACGIECDVFERYVELDDPTNHPSPIGLTNMRTEFIIVPRAPAITDEERRRIIHMVDKLRPSNTIPTIYDGDYPRLERPVTNIASTSDRFNLVRYVSGRNDIDWPDIDLSAGYWIDTGENEAPHFAYLDRQEEVTYITILNVTASTEHVGVFNQDQRAFFGHLQNTENFLTFPATHAVANNVVPFATNIPWVSTREIPGEQILLNRYYPLGYFALENVPSFVQAPPAFWASVESLPEDSPNESLVLDFGRTRPVNFIDLNVCQKPLNIQVQYGDGTTWYDVVPTDWFEGGLEIPYMPSTENPWHYFEYPFELVQTRYLRLVFNREDTPFPLTSSDPFAWSIEVQNLRAMHVVTEVTDFVIDNGTDILGNSYRTDINTSEAGNVIDDDDETMWQSQPNPSPSAVEALYFDLRTGWNVGTMSYLDQWDMQTLNSWTMADMENHFEDGVVIDEVFVDPVTTGVMMHFYYSLDESTSDWDNKLWIPVPRHYIAKKGFHAFPRPTFVKFVKVEFSNLAAAPYQPVEHPTVQGLTYRRYPTWVQNYFSNQLWEIPVDIRGVETVTIDPLVFGFQKPIDSMHGGYELEREALFADHTNEVTTAIQALLNQQKISNGQSQVEDRIHLRSTIMWQDDLLAQMDSSRVLTRVAQEDRDGILDTGWTSELGLPIQAPPVLQSSNNLTPSINQKKPQPLWFARKCRHQYQLAKGYFDSKLCFYVAIKAIEFYRRDYRIEIDEPVYLETFEDDSHTELNEFTQQDWQFVVYE